MTESSAVQSRVSDSPWFWVTLFCSAALAVLVVARGQVAQRQAIIERQNQGRQRAAEMAATGEAVTEMSTPENTVITIDGLIVVLAVILLISGNMYWLWRRANRRHGGAGKTSPADEPGQTAQGRASQSTDSTP